MVYIWQNLYVFERNYIAAKNVQKLTRQITKFSTELVTKSANKSTYLKYPLVRSKWTIKPVVYQVAYPEYENIKSLTTKSREQRYMVLK